MRRFVNLLRLIGNAAAGRRRLRRRSREVSGTGDALDLAFSFRSGRLSIVPVQIRSEIEGLLDLLAAEPPRTVVEIGTWNGGTLYLLARAAAADALLVTVDIGGGPGARLGRFSPVGLLCGGCAAPGQRVVPLLRRDSHDPATLAKVEHVLGRRPVDLLFIDGDHSYDGVRSDFETYGRLVRPGGLIAFHDISPGAPEGVGEVPRFWQELKRERDVIELVESWDQGGLGIGVVRVPAANA